MLLMKTLNVKYYNAKNSITDKEINLNVVAER